MQSYHIKPHTADIRMTVEGTTLEELFGAALSGMANIIRPDDLCPTQGQTPHTITLAAPDVTALLIDFLSAVLTQTQITKNLYCCVTFKQLSEHELTAELAGHPIDRFDEDIKAVTYHEAEVKKNEQGNYETVIVFDI